MDVLEPAAIAASPRLVWHESDGYVRESAPRLVPKRDGFELRVDVGTIESYVMVKKGIFRYQINGDTVERLQPIAMNGRDFVDEWLQAPWIDAKKWSAAESLPALEKIHKEFTKSRTTENQFVGYEYGPVRSCTLKGRYQVEIDADPGRPMFFAIEQGTNSFTLLNLAKTPDLTCNGPDIMQPQN